MTTYKDKNSESVECLDCLRQGCATVFGERRKRCGLARNNRYTHQPQISVCFYNIYKIYKCCRGRISQIRGYRFGYPWPIC